MSLEFQIAFWALLALVALIIEITHRTFYLLIVCIACALAALAVWLFHFGLAMQVVVVVAACVVGIPLAGRWRRRSAAIHFPDDQGQPVKVIAVKDGRLRVIYRGTEWDAEYHGPAPEKEFKPGDQLRIKKLDGNVLKLTNL